MAQCATDLFPKAAWVLAVFTGIGAYPGRVQAEDIAGENWDPCVSSAVAAACLDSLENTPPPEEEILSARPYAEDLDADAKTGTRRKNPLRPEPWSWYWRSHRPLQATQGAWGSSWRHSLGAEAHPLTWQSRWTGDSLTQRRMDAEMGRVSLSLGDIPPSPRSGLIDFIHGHGHARGWRQADKPQGMQDAWLWTSRPGLNGALLTWSPGPWQAHALGAWNRLLSPGRQGGSESEGGDIIDAGLWGLGASGEIAGREWSVQSSAYRLERGREKGGFSWANGLEVSAPKRAWGLGMGGLLHGNPEGLLQASAFGQVRWARPRSEAYWYEMKLRQAGEDWAWPFTPDPIAEPVSAQTDTLFPAPAQGQGDMQALAGWPLADFLSGRLWAQTGAVLAWDPGFWMRVFRSENALAWRRGNLHVTARFWNRWQWQTHTDKVNAGRRWRAETKWAGDIWQWGLFTQTGELYGEAYAAENGGESLRGYPSKTTLSPWPWQFHLGKKSRRSSSQTPRWQALAGAGADLRRPNGFHASLDGKVRWSNLGHLGSKAWLRCQDREWQVGWQFRLGAMGRNALLDNP